MHVSWAQILESNCDWKKRDKYNFDIEILFQALWLFRTQKRLTYKISYDLKKKKLAFTKKLYIWTYHLQYGPLDNLRTGYFHTGIVQVFKIMEEDSNFTISLICKICFYVFSVVHYTKYRHERERDTEGERLRERERVYVPLVLDLTFPPLKSDALGVNLCTRTIGCFWIISAIISIQIEIC